MFSMAWTGKEIQFQQMVLGELLRSWSIVSCLVMRG